MILIPTPLSSCLPTYHLAAHNEVDFLKKKLRLSGQYLHIYFDDPKTEAEYANFAGKHQELRHFLLIMGGFLALMGAVGFVMESDFIATAILLVATAGFAGFYYLLDLSHPVKIRPWVPVMYVPFRH